ncbi:MAG TPA: SDR family oxidoreductase [Bacteroidales bacterium]|nr:SDR family oxidoreductase [Bacteroidales bacterium]
MKIDFSGKTVLITGASRGIGRATAVKFAECGANVVVHYKEYSGGALKTLSLLAEGKHLLMKADLTDPVQIENLVTKSIRKTGRIDVLVNNAGIYKQCDMRGCSFAEWQKNFDETLKTNIYGPAHLSFLIGKHMAGKGGGKIINVSSRGAFRGEPLAPAYGASKAALNQFSQSMACLMAPENVFVYVVAPGFVETDMSKHILKSEAGVDIRRQSPLNRVARPEEIANTILLLASDHTEFLTGGIIDINGASYLRS